MDTTLDVDGTVRRPAPSRIWGDARSTHLDCGPHSQQGLDHPPGRTLTGTVVRVNARRDRRPGRVPFDSSHASDVVEARIRILRSHLGHPLFVLDSHLARARTRTRRPSSTSRSGTSRRRDPGAATTATFPPRIQWVGARWPVRTAEIEAALTARRERSSFDAWVSPRATAVGSPNGGANRDGIMLECPGSARTRKRSGGLVDRTAGLLVGPTARRDCWLGRLYDACSARFR